LHQIGCLHLLPELFDRILVPQAVVGELERGRLIGINLPDIRSLQWVGIRVAKVEMVPTTADLGAGEKEVLALGMERPGAVLIMDERLGRSCANALKLRFTGVLGILLSAKREGRISRIAPLIGQLDQLGFRLSSKTRAAILKQAGE
jgi:uncharacterized protein